MKCFRLIVAVLFAVSASMAGETEILFQRLKQDYSSDVPVDSALMLAGTLRLDGTWPGLEYNKKGHMPIEHLKNVRRLSESHERYCPDPSRKADCKKIEDAALKSLRYWFSHREKLVSDNWWMNEIGAPRELAPVAFLMWDVVPESLRLQVVSQFPESPSGNGANRAWISELVAIRGILQQRDSLVRLGLQNIKSTVMVTDQEGHQEDHSYFMHGNLLYNGAYGKISLSIVAKWADLCRETVFAFDQETVRAASALALDGSRWMMWKGIVDPMVLGREIARKGGDSRSEGILSTIERLSRIDSLNKNYYNLWMKNIKEGSPDSLRGCRYFWRGEFMVCRDSAHYVSLKMSSKNTVGSESINRENRKGKWLGMGVLSVYNSEGAYGNIYPLWDWSKLPGVTGDGSVEQKEKRVTNMAEFVGGLSDGEYGVAAMELVRQGIGGKKSWFFVDGLVVALGAGISSTLDGEITTSLDQRIYRSKAAVQESGDVVYDLLYSTKAAWHDSIGYRSLDGEPFYVQVQKRNGNWKEIGTSKEQENAPVMSLWRSHGVRPKDAGYAYSVAVNVGRDDFLKDADKNGAEILENSSRAQVVQVASKSFVAGTLYESQKIQFGSVRLSFSGPCVFLVELQGKKMKLVLADPTKKQSSLKVDVEKVTGGKVSLLYSSVMNLPQKMLAGKSISVWIDL